MTGAESYPNGLDSRQWTRYVTLWTYAIAFTVFGLGVFAVGMQWGMSGMEAAIVETAQGVTFVDGGAERGAFLGPVVSAFGMLMILVGHSMAEYAAGYGTVVEYPGENA